VRIRTTTTVGARPPPDLQDNPTREHRPIWPPRGTLARGRGLRQPRSAPCDLSAELAPDIARTISLAALRYTATTDGEVSASWPPPLIPPVSISRR
jgi:hypothetical protein